MVVLKPMLEGELPARACVGCGTIGIRSPIRARSTFWQCGRGVYRPRCPKCESGRRLTPEELQRQRDRWHARSEEDRQRRIAQIRAAEARRKERDPEKWKADRRVSNARQRAAVAQDPVRRARSLERKRTARRFETEREVEPDRRSQSGVRHPIGPFREWLQDQIDKLVRAGCEHPVREFADTIDIAPRRLYDWLHADIEDIDEAIVDRAVTHDGRYSLHDIYPGWDERG